MEQEPIVTIEAIPNPPPCYREYLRVLSGGVEIGVVLLNSHPLSLRSRSKSPFAGWHGHSDHIAEIPGLQVSAFTRRGVTRRLVLDTPTGVRGQQAGQAVLLFVVADLLVFLDPVNPEFRAQVVGI